MSESVLVAGALSALYYVRSILIFLPAEFCARLGII